MQEPVGAHLVVPRVVAKLKRPSDKIEEIFGRDLRRFSWKVMVTGYQKADVAQAEALRPRAATPVLTATA
jgi:hypothetical protein